MQQRFTAALMRIGVVERACEEVGMSVSSAYSLRNAPGGEGFARAWKEALTRAADRMLDLAFEQAMLGEEVPIYDRDGVRVGVKWKQNTRLLMYMLRAYHPDRFRFAHKDVRHADEPVPPAALPPGAAIASLAPVTPADPHLLTPPQQRDRMIARAHGDAAELATSPPQEREPYRRPPVPAPHPRLTRRAERNRQLRQAREDRQAVASGLHFPSTSDAEALPADPLSDYSYWVKSEAGRHALAQEAAAAAAKKAAHRRAAAKHGATPPPDAAADGDSAST